MSARSSSRLRGVESQGTNTPTSRLVGVVDALAHLALVLEINRPAGLLAILLEDDAERGLGLLDEGGALVVVRPQEGVDGVKRLRGGKCG